MPSKTLTFTKAVLLSMSRTPAGGSVKISCAPSKPVAKAMEWGDVPEWQTSSTPAGKLAATLVEFTPTASDLAKHAFDLAATAVRSFEFVRVQVKKGKTAKKIVTYRLELHCTVDWTDPNGARKIEQYMGQVLESSMKVTYEPEPEQQELLTTEEQRQAALPESD